MNAVSVNKATQLLQGLQSTGNEGQQLTAVIEMCQVSDHRGPCIIQEIYRVFNLQGTRDNS